MAKTYNDLGTQWKQIYLIQPKQLNSQTNKYNSAKIWYIELKISEYEQMGYLI